MRLDRKERRILRRRFQAYAAEERLAMKARLREAGREIRRRGLAKNDPAAMSLIFKAVYGGALLYLGPPSPLFEAFPFKTGPAPGALLETPWIIPAREGDD